ncbi:MAG: hypothetical protein K8S23_11020 [Candidatus Cloacimonetes bacterium]|nr:hypothetical protein [Candidatus Cloacimonadota bacterium]
MNRNSLIKNIEELYKSVQTDIQNMDYSNGLISILKVQKMINAFNKNELFEKYFSLQADIYFTKGYLYHNHFSLSTQALANFLFSLKIAGKYNLNKLTVNCYLEIGKLYKKQQKFNKAIDFFFKIINFDQSDISTNIKDEVFEQIAEIYYEKGEFKTSYSYYKKALQFASQYDETDRIEILKYKIGKLLYLQDEPDKALEILLQFMESKEEHPKQLKILIYSKIALCYINQEKNIEAKKYVNKIISNIEEIDNKKILAEIYKDLSQYYEKVSNYKKSFEYIKITKEINDKNLNSAADQKLKNIQTVFDLESKEKEAELSELKNVELVKANRFLKTHREHLHLVNKIIRHDIINNLAVIRSSIRIYRTDSNSNLLDNCETYINKSFDLIDRMQQMEFFLSENRTLKVFDLFEIFKIIINNYCDLKITLTGNARIFADDALISVFDNIISNAKRHGKADKIDINIISKKEFCEIHIADNGIGIPIEIHEKVFEENFIYGPTGQTGLGLYIVKKNIMNYQGSVHIEDNIPNGTTFVIKLKKAD